MKKIATKVTQAKRRAGQTHAVYLPDGTYGIADFKSTAKERDGFIHPTRKADYQQLLIDANLQMESLPELLNECMQPMRREIKLDTALINASHSALDTIIDMVDTYLSEDETSEGMDSAVSPEHVC